MSKYTVVIADDNTAFCDVISRLVNAADDMELAGVAKDGISAVNMVINRCPDMLILNDSMPKLDGIGVMRRINELRLKNKPKVITVSNDISEEFVKAASKNGASFNIHKAAGADLIMRRIRMTME